jgi:hypothetical protein
MNPLEIAAVVMSVLSLLLNAWTWRQQREARQLRRARRRADHRSSL